ncbi:GNAT family N-acetyltransferase [Rhodococcus chondri]|uniref:N-acetyltransferase domain-containing protein n=1 Tax=Rhodococcus chondri TaxID=3065941 RepID=A0ABU7JP92_9NOCA|nr:GNAT family N-acetyltransferase [Rhodococcus sp. CC-R104]MEE2031851.1 hypothetical protein [Rhodococcus sp. CC-R104]
MTLRHLGTDPDSGPLEQEVERWYSAEDARGWMGEGFDAHSFLERISGPCTSAVDYQCRTHRCTTLGWVLFDDANRPVAFMGGDVMVERSLTEHNDGSMMWEEIGPRTLGFTYVVAPEHQRKRHGPTLVRAVLEHPDLAGVDVLSCSIDWKNEASLKLIRGILEFRETGGDEKSAFFAYEKSSRPHPE